MKRVVFTLSMLVLLFLGCVSVFADPHVVPDSSICLVNSPLVITATYIPDSDF